MIPVNMPSAKDIRDLYADVCTDETELDDIETKWWWLLNHPECALVRSLLEHGFTLTFDTDTFKHVGIVMFDLTWGITDSATGPATRLECVQVSLGWNAAGSFVCKQATWKQPSGCDWHYRGDPLSAWGVVGVNHVVRAAIELKGMVANREQ